MRTAARHIVIQAKDMDFPLAHHDLTWRDSIYWRVTSYTLFSAGTIIVLAFPPAAYLTSQLMYLCHQPVDVREMVAYLSKGACLAMPYLWISFFVLERLAQPRTGIGK